MEELARGFHVRVGGAPVGGQLALNRLLQDGLLELGEFMVIVVCSRLMRGRLADRCGFATIRSERQHPAMELYLTRPRTKPLAHGTGAVAVDGFESVVTLETSFSR